jgi:hypothetical protein
MAPPHRMLSFFDNADEEQLKPRANTRVELYTQKCEDRRFFFFGLSPGGWSIKQFGNTI